MAEATSKVQRWLDLVAFLAGRRVPVAFEEIMERVPPYAADWAEADERGRASVRRKFERDKKELRALGIPIETVEYTINYGAEQAQGYLLRSRDFYLPYLRLVSEGEGEGEAPEAEGGPAGAQRASAGARGGTSGTSAGTRPGPAFELREPEARAAVDALRRVSALPSFPFPREARAALRKLTFDLGPDFAGSGTGVGERGVRYLDPPGAGDLRSRLQALTDALLRRKEVGFGYYAIHRDERSERRVRPYGLLFQQSRWYLVGHDLDRDGLRIFRVDRMGEPEANTRLPGTPDYQVPADFDLGRWAGRPAWALPGHDDDAEEPLEVTVRFAFPRSLWAERNHHGEPVDPGDAGDEGDEGDAGHRGDDGSQLRRFRVLDPEPFLRWLLTLRGDAAIESPAELEDRRLELVRRVAALHGGDVDDDADGGDGGDGGDG